MSGRRLLVGVVDSGAAPHQLGHLTACRRFVDGEEVESAPDVCDEIGHGTRCLDILLERLAGRADLAVAQVFGKRLATTPRLVAAGLDWLAGEGARVVNMSLGLAADREVLREACARAHDAGAILVAATPARGAPAWPAAYAHVLAVTGDARCAPGEVSDLEGRTAEFGTYVGAPETRTAGGAVVAGASIATAHFCALVAGYLLEEPEADLDAVRAHLRAKARYHGPERRRGAAGNG